MGIAGLQKFALIFTLFIGFMLGWSFNGVVSGVGAFAARLTPQAGAPVPSQTQTLHEVKVGNSIIYSP